MQGGYVSLLYSTSEKPLEYWSKQKSKTGLIRKVYDKELNENVLEIQDADEQNCQKTWIMCPPNPDQILNIKLSFLVILMKCTGIQCLIQLQLVDKDSVRHLINFSNVEPKKKSNSRTSPSTMQLILEPGWNRIEIDLRHLSKIFDAQFEAVTRLKICSSCQIRRIYFADRHYEDTEMPLGLYHGFLDYYMMKWGIKAIERGIQTRKTAAKTAAAKENSQHPPSGLSKLFLKNLQAKSDQIVEEFFSRQSVKSLKEYLDFKRKAKIKPYAIPDGNPYRYSKRSDSSLIDIEEFKKNILNQNHLYEKLMFEEEKDKSKSLDSKVNKTDSKNPILRIYKYKYPDTLDKKSNWAKKEQLLKYPNMIKSKK